MSILQTSKTKKFVAGFVAFAFALSLSFGAVAPAQAQSVDTIAAQIAVLQAQLAALQGSSMSTGFTFTKNLKMGDSNSDVMQLQKALNMSADTQVSASGAGSPGNESSYFGAKTKAAVMKYQASKGVSNTGYVGPLTRGKLNASVAMTPTTPTTPTTPVTTAPSGTGLTVVASPMQPAAQLAPLGAARIPFTKVVFTAGNDGDVSVSGLVVERGGPSTDSAFAGIVLLDEEGIQVGVAKTLNSAHQVTLSQSFVVTKGSSRTMTLAANRVTSDATSASAGSVATLSLVQVNTSATITGSLPIVGTAQTLNTGLTIGTITNARGPLDPAVQAGGVSKNVGTTGYIFSSIKVTAGSQEDVLIKSIRWNQASSSSSSDLANIVTVVDGVSYQATIDSTGKYYVSSFGSGIKIEKGFSKEISAKGDIIGGSGRTVAFNIEKTTDLNVSGLLYGYGITPPTSGTGFSTGSIWYGGSTISINSGSITISSDPSIPSQNIAINLANQPLGGFQVEVKGEPVSVASMVFGLDVVGPADNITNVSLVNQNGAVLAGPVDQSSGKVTFTDTVTFPVGITKLALKGKAGTNFSNNNTVRASTTPSTNWTTVTGQVTSQTITPAPGSVIQPNTMTVKTAVITISVLPEPVAQTVVAGGQGFVFTKFQLDAGASGEDIRVNTLPLLLTTSGTATNLTSCQLWDGSASLNTGSNSVNPTGSSPISATFTLDNALIIAKGTAKTLTLSCNISTSATGNFQWGITSSPTATGVTSGQSVTVTLNSSTGNQMAMTTGGSMTVTLDSSSPTYRPVSAGTTGNIASVLRFHATNENMSLQTIGLQLTSSATSTNADVTSVTLWDGATQVGSAIFDGTTDVGGLQIATSTLTTPVTISTVADKLITIKVDVPNQGTNQSGHPGALIAVDYNGGQAQGTKAVGASSGTTVYSGSADTATGGIRVFKSFPTLTYSSTGGTLISGVNDLLSVTVAADTKGDIQLNKLTFTLSSTTASLTGNAISFSGPTGNVSSTTNSIVQNVASGANDVTVYFDSTSNTADKTISAGSSKTFTLRGTVAITGNSNQNGSVSVALKADTGYPALPYLLSTSTEGYMATTTRGAIGSSNGINNANIIWSPLSTTTAVTASGYGDWTNGYGLPGCFSSSGLGQNCTARVLSK